MTRDGQTLDFRRRKEEEALRKMSPPSGKEEGGTEKNVSETISKQTQQTKQNKLKTNPLCLLPSRFLGPLIDLGEDNW